MAILGTAALGGGQAMAQKPASPWTVTNFNLTPEVAPGPRRDRGVDISLPIGAIGGRENITVVAPRQGIRVKPEIPDHVEESDVLPNTGIKFDTPYEAPGYCNSSLHTVGGQPASGADLVGGLGGGSC